MSAEARDLFGRTEAELLEAISWQERVAKIADVYRGNEELGKRVERRKALLDVDRRQLALLRGERVTYPEPPRELTESQLAQWRKDFTRRR